MESRVEDASGTEFAYILEKISGAKIRPSPFPHIKVSDFLTPKHLRDIVTAPEIDIKDCEDVEDLKRRVESLGWKIQPFPGCTADWGDYVKERRGERSVAGNGTCTSRGVAWRLSRPSPTLSGLLAFMRSQRFHSCIRMKFGLRNGTKILSAAQKYLTGYEISPHPDIRSKALTYLLNIFPDPDLEEADCLTQLCSLKSEHEHIALRWQSDPSSKRSWIPWDHCDVEDVIRENNTLLMFAPMSMPPSLHAVKLDYDDLKSQRTQVYGNLFYTGGSVAQPPSVPLSRGGSMFAAYDRQTGVRSV